jgi:GH25 family lysozyme M1 (1,4-beta-N-acetylmuramidase)
MPNSMVIDLSHHNAAVDFVAAKAAGVVGVIHKVTQGGTFVDQKYADRRAQALKLGLLWGGYHFGTGDDVAQQLQNFLTHAKAADTTLVALDFELNEADPSNTMSLAQARAFLRGIESALKRKAVLYCGSHLRDQLERAHDPYLAEHRLWWAQYASAPVLQVSWNTYWLWQHSDGFHGPDPQRVDGVGPCDCDTFDNSAAQLADAWAT